MSHKCSREICILTVHWGFSPRNQTLLSLLPNMFNKRFHKKYICLAVCLLLRLCMLMGRKVHFTKVYRFPAAFWHPWDASAFQPDPVSAAGATQGGRRWNIYANCCKTSHKRWQEACDEELSSSAVIMTSLKLTEEHKSKARARRARVPDGACRRSEPL